MTRTRNMSDLLDSSGDVKTTALDNTSSDLVDDSTPQLGGDLSTNGNDVNFGNNDKAQFGAGNDLQIYHDGNRSWINDAGAGDLRAITNGSEVAILSGTPSTNEYMIQAVKDGAVNLYNSGIKKLETTSSGIDVTGTVTMDGGSTSADFSFGDNDKAKFGAGDDLQIWHTGTDNIIRSDNDASSFYLQSDNEFRFTNVGGSTTHATIKPNAPFIVGSHETSGRMDNGVFERTENRKGIQLDGAITTHDAWVYDDAGNNTNWIFDPNGCHGGYNYQDSSDANDAYGTVTYSRRFYNGTGGSTYGVIELSTNHGWNGGTIIVELISVGYYASGYRRYVVHSGYSPAFTHVSNLDHGNHFGTMTLTDLGQFADGTTNTASTQTDGSWHHSRLNVVGTAYGTMVVRITVQNGWKVKNALNNPSQVKLL